MPTKTGKRHPDNRDTDHPKQQQGRRNLNWGDVPTWVTALFTIVIAGAAVVQWKTVTKQIDLTRRQIDLESRPWIMVAKFDLEGNAIRVNARTKTLVTLTNTGKSPAVTHVDTVCAVGPNSAAIPTPKPFPESSPPVSAMAIAPGQSAVSTGICEFIISDKTITAILEGRDRLYVFGRVKYTGPSKVDYFTHFCAMFMVDYARGPDLFGSSCPEFNSFN